MIQPPGLPGAGAVLGSGRGGGACHDRGGTSIPRVGIPQALGIPPDEGEHPVLVASRRLWLAPFVGSAPGLVDLVLDRAMTAAQSEQR